MQVVVESENGPFVVDRKSVAMVGKRFQKANRQPARALVLAGGGRDYILDTEENLARLLDPDALKALRTAEKAHDTAQAAKVPPRRRGRPRTAPAGAKRARRPRTPRSADADA